MNAVAEMQRLCVLPLSTTLYLYTFGTRIFGFAVDLCGPAMKSAGRVTRITRFLKACNEYLPVLDNRFFLINPADFSPPSPG